MKIAGLHSFPGVQTACMQSVPSMLYLNTTVSKYWMCYLFPILIVRLECLSICQILFSLSYPSARLLCLAWLGFNW